MEPLGLAIDFGSTRTKVAYFNSDKNEAQLIELGQEIRPIIPSVFYIPKEGGNPKVGDDALMMVDHDPEGIVIGLKKEIHRPGKVYFGPGRPSIERVQLASEMFSHIRRLCEKEVFLGKNINFDICTLTVPVSFEEKQRACIRKAAELAGFKQIVLIEEPVAAAMAWLPTAGKNLADHVIICDAGGGTTDFGLLRFEKGRFESVPDVPTDGFPSGGNDIDEWILDRVLEAGTYDPGSAPKKSRGAFLVKIRQVKEFFARQPIIEKPISLSGITLQVPLRAVKDSGNLYIEQTVEGLKRFLSRCNTVVNGPQIPILLVGGGSRLNGLKEAIEALAPERVFQWNQSDYATVLGAATPLLKPQSPTGTKSNKNLQGYREVVKNFIDQQNFTIKNLEDLTSMSTKLGLSKEQASRVEIEILGMPKEIFYDRSQEKKNKENLEKYRDAVKKFIGTQNFTIKNREDLNQLSNQLGLSKEQASQIEIEVLWKPKKQEREENLAKYRHAVKKSHGKQNFTITDSVYLTQMSKQLNISNDQASQIEIEVLGMPKEQKVKENSSTIGAKGQKGEENFGIIVLRAIQWLFALIFVLGGIKKGCGDKPEKTQGVPPSHFMEPQQKAPSRR